MISDDCSYFAASKLIKKRTTIYGGAGEWAKVLKGFELIEKRTKDWPEEFDVEIIALRKDGIWLYGGTGRPVRVINDVWAIGSGANYFLGAYAACGDFKKAMQIAVKHDSNSHEPIEYHTLGLKNAQHKTQDRK